MAFQIPRARDVGLGRQTTGAIPAGTPRPIRDIDTGLDPLEVIQAGTQLAGVVVRERALKAKEVEREAEKDRAKLQKAQALKTKTTTNNTMTGIFGRIKETTDFLSSADLPPREQTEAFESTMRSIESEFFDQVPQELQEERRSQLDKWFISAKSSFTKAVGENVKTRALAVGSEVLDAIAKRAATDPASVADYKARINETVEGLPLDADKKVALKQRRRAAVDINIVEQRITDRDGGLFRTDLDSLISDLQAKDGEGNFKNFKDLPPDARTAFIDEAQRALISDNNTKTNLKNNELKTAFANYKEKKLAGFPINTAQEATLGAALKGTPLEQDFKETKETGESLEFLARRYAENPLEFGAARIGIDVPPLNIADIESLPEQLQARIQVGKAVQAGMSGSFAPILTTGEVKQLGALMKSDTKAGIALMDNMMNVVGSDIMTGVAMQVASTAPAMGTVIRAIADGNTAFAVKIAEGQELIRTKAIAMPKAVETNEWFWDEAGRALEAYPNNGREAQQAWLSVYASNARAAGEQTGEFDSDIAEASFKEVVGDVVSVNGFQTVMQEGLDETDFRNGIRRLRADFIRATGGIQGMGDAEAAREIREDGHFYSAGPNIYRVILDGRLVMTNNGAPLQLSVSGLRQQKAIFPAEELTGFFGALE